MKVGPHAARRVIYDRTIEARSSLAARQQIARMPLWKAILFVAAFLAEESSAFLASPARFLACQEPGVLDRRHKIPLQMGKGKVNRRKKQKQQPKSLGVVGRKERDYIGVAEDGDGVEEGGNVPRVVVMDLDYTLW